MGSIQKSCIIAEITFIAIPTQPFTRTGIFWNISRTFSWEREKSYMHRDKDPFLPGQRRG